MNILQQSITLLSGLTIDLSIYSYLQSKNLIN